jgi:hypothetical protein
MHCAISLLFGPQRVDLRFQHTTFRKRACETRHLVQNDNLLRGRWPKSPFFVQTHIGT